LRAPERRFNRVKLAKLLTGIEYRSIIDVAKVDADIKRIISNSHDAQKGDLFVAIKGGHFDGHNFLNYISSKGVEIAIVQEAGLSRDGLVQVKVNDTRRALSILARNFYKDPSKDINLIGITGTNGKTTVSYILESIFRGAGLNTGRIGTISYKIGKDVIDAKHTTPDTLILNELLHRLVKQSVPYCVMEVSSHGLDQRRAEDVNFKAAVFTNLTHEHLDYHKTLDAYLKTKLKLFESLVDGSYAVINKDSAYFDDLICRIDVDTVTYGIKKDSDVIAKDLKYGLNESRFTISTPRGSFDVKTSLIGRHNVYNILAASSVAINEEISLDMIKKGIEALGEVPGRMEPIKCGQDFSVFVDYAHTEDALKNALGTLRKLTKNKIILVFGCGGDRDKAKRPEMGKVAAKLADFTIITSDNPRSEDPVEIAEEIEKGFRGISKKYTIVLDRFEAIKKSLLAADEDVIVLIAGKGHEQKQIFKSEIVSFDDREAARNILKTL